MKKITLFSIILVGTLFANESSDLNIEKAISSLNKATSKLIEKYQNLENELVDIKMKIQEFDSIKTQLSNSDSTSIGNFVEEKVIPIKSKSISSNGKVYVNTWYVNLREKPRLDSKVLRNARAGEVFSVVETLENFYLLDNGLYLHKSISDIFAPVKIYVKRNGFIELQTTKIPMLKKVYEGNVLNAVGLHRNNKWYILKDGGFIDKNLVKIEG